MKTLKNVNKVIFGIAMIAFIANANAQAPDSWTQKADLPGSARQVAAGFSIGTKGYMGTGYDGNGPLQATAAAVTPAEEFDLVPQ